MTEFGTGQSLKDACSWLQNDHERHVRILDVAERNSVIEGLPPFRKETRREILKQLLGISRSPASTLSESSPAWAGRTDPPSLTSLRWSIHHVQSLVLNSALGCFLLLQKA